MKKRFPKPRKRIKSAPAGAKKRRIFETREQKNREEYVKGGALVPYEKREIEDVALNESAEEVSAEQKNGEMPTPKDTPRKDSDGRREDVLRLVCGFVVVFSLFCAVVLACFAFAVATERGVGNEEEAVFAEDENEESNDGKVIFIHTDSSGYGLTAPEIYEKCARTAVSVSAAFPDGGEGIGSGFILTEDGYIATASHVIDGAESVRVILWQGEIYNAEVVSADSLSDVALLKIKPSWTLPCAELGDSAELLAGERVYAIGTPADLSYAGSLSSGEVSCAQRTVPIYSEGVKKLEKKLKVIQITAEVNKGNSGCPLFDANGRVVGMVTMRLGADFRGISFALPTGGIVPILQAMKEGREIDAALISGVAELPARLGVSCHTDESDGVYGCRVDSVSDKSAVFGALKVGDLIVQIDERIITAPSDISSLIEEKTVGEKIRVTLIRSGQRLTYDILLGS